MAHQVGHASADFSISIELVVEPTYAAAAWIEDDLHPQLSEAVPMHAGTISALDSRSGFGLIDSDDGRILPFNQDAIQDSILDTLQVGARVEFIEAIIGEEPRAVTVHRPA
jgi:cold shock CspA family protein